ncbi:MAG: tetratricopeptide repeat protein [Devosia sp.]|uniref:O-linked N-acetylglucosamine transferase, SPINDLY family protein n=1 Tax=Devosia sp. TaxID=1871048 RepID=UPI001AD247FB|nr:tetratricopeptide repeat protein [Devosia sp.]MBN9317398.1 tetratricopeptide repeat protein [Devosia sp.]
MSASDSIRPLLEQALALLQKGSAADAYELLAQALAQAPTDFDALNLAGVAATRSGRAEVAVDLLERATAERPTHFGAQNNLGIALRAAGHAGLAAEAYRRAIALEPRYAAARTNLGAALCDLHQYDEAVESFDASLVARPDHAETLVLKARALRRLHRHSEALDAADQALVVSPASAEVHVTRGDVLRSLGQHGAALAMYRRALELAPRDATIPGLIAYYQLRLCDWTGLVERRKALLERARAGEAALIPFAGLLLFNDAQAQLTLARATSSRFLSAPPAVQSPRRGDKLHIGYFCADLRNHPTVHLIAELFDFHDRDRFEITAFAFPVGKVDQYTEQVRASVDSYVDIGEMSDADAAQLARDMSLDIAIDLMGHTKGARTGIFSRRAAPIQVNYLAYPGTMGASFIDYLIADRTIIPPDATSAYSERIVWMPDYYAPRDTRIEVPTGRIGRSDESLPDDAIVYCSFNQTSKIMPETFGDWMSILSQVERGVLWLLDGGEGAVENLRRAAAEAGVDPDRLIFAQRRSLAEHLERLRLADLCLDTLPYNAHTTASDALYVGVPILTMPGETFASRVCASIVTAAGMPELVAIDRVDYIRRAAALGSDPAQLSTLRERLARQLAGARLFDMKRYARAFEAALSAMHDRYLHGLAPDHIAVNDDMLSQR